ncbi:MAG: lactate utilization protein, partial [Candidatus Promineifilaceae bacterium]|nr:lactate utilization protein [Candidatus Promineifilaceae bacterium]
LSCLIYEPQSDDETASIVREIIGNDRRVSSWGRERIPFPKLENILEERGIEIVAPSDPSVRIGLTGADAALAATGSVVVSSGEETQRGTSLLPAVHVVFVAQERILAHMEDWLERQRESNLDIFRRSSNIVIISGASRTADIAMELILGMHGPKELHIIILPPQN